MKVKIIKDTELILIPESDKDRQFIDDLIWCKGGVRWTTYNTKHGLVTDINLKMIEDE